MIQPFKIALCSNRYLSTFRSFSLVVQTFEKLLFLGLSCMKADVSSCFILMTLIVSGLHQLRQEGMYVYAAVNAV